MKLPPSLSSTADKSMGNILKGFTFSFYMTNALLVSFLPTYFISLGFTKTQVGIIYSLGPGIGILANFLWGYLSDKYHTLKKTIMVVILGQLVFMGIFFQIHTFGWLPIVMGFFYFFQTPLTPLND